MKGPNPVWILATKRLSQSRPRPTARMSGRLPPAHALSGGTRGESVARIGRRRMSHRGRPDHFVGRGSRVVFRCLFQIVLTDFDEEGGAFRPGPEMNESPIDGDLARAAAKESAEIDDQGLGPAIAADNDIDDEAHRLAGEALDLDAKDPRGARGHSRLS